MIDYDLNNIKILPANHIAFKDYDYVVGVDKKNKVFENVILGVIGAGTLVLIYYVVKYADERYKKQN
ncbi:MAG: hypothetical protein IM568_07515 [Flavobacterium sp.]|nr:hypothetical protein [Flavobacterium sp.]